MFDEFDLGLNDMNNINNGIEEDNNSEGRDNGLNNKILLFVIIFISLLIVLFNFYQFFFLIRLIKKAYTLLPKKVFEECYLYNGFSDLLLELYSFIFGLDLLFLCWVSYLEIDISTYKFNSIFFYLNYLVFGPFTLGIIVAIIAYYDKLMYVCVRYNPQNKIFNFKLIFFIFFSSLFSLLITFIGIWILGESYFENSIKFRPSGNNILGFAFWKYGLSHSKKYKERINDVDINQMINNDI